MLNKKVTFKTITLLTLASLSLVACSQESKNAPFPLSKPQEAKTTVKSSTTQSTSNTKTATTKQTIPSTTTNKQLSENQPQAEQIQEELANSPQLATETVATTEHIAPPIAPTNPISPEIPVAEVVEVDASTTSHDTPAIEVSTAEENNAAYLPITNLLAGPVAGNWASASGHFWSMMANGSSANGSSQITSVVPQADGSTYLTLQDTVSGYGVYAHYYPAGLPLMITVLRHDEEGNLVESDIIDPSDNSQERLIIGNGGHTAIHEDQLEAFRLDILYRQ